MEEGALSSGNSRWTWSTIPLACAAQTGKRKTFHAGDVTGICSYVSEIIFSKGDEQQQQQQFLQSHIFWTPHSGFEHWVSPWKDVFHNWTGSPSQYLARWYFYVHFCEKKHIKGQICEAEELEEDWGKEGGTVPEPEYEDSQDSV